LSGAVGEVTDQEFESQVLGAEGPVLVDFWAEWCVPCHLVSPLLEEIAREKAGAVSAYKMNVDDNPMASQKYGVMSIPTIILFKGGEAVARVVGVRPKDAILRELEPHLVA
jgi:thioredoxin 1